MRYKKTTVGSAYGKKKAPAKRAGARGNGKKKKKTVAHGTRRRSR